MKTNARFSHRFRHRALGETLRTENGEKETRWSLISKCLETKYFCGCRLRSSVR
jgi:hypothetical protein